MRINEIDRSNDVYSPWKVAFHNTEIKMMKRNMMFPPKCIQLDLTSKCPHNCIHCAYKNSGFDKLGMEFNIREEMPYLTAMDIPRQMKKARIQALELTGGGEPLAYPWIKEFIEQCEKYRIELAIVTNGMLLTSQIQAKLRNLKWIRFSIDAATKKTYKKVHGVNCWDIVQKHLYQVIARGYEGCKVGISFIITPHNYHEILGAARMYRLAGADNIRFSFWYDSGFSGRLNQNQKRVISDLLAEAKLQDTEDYKVFGTMSRLESYKNSNDFNFCGYQFFTWAIGSDCLVYPCCVEKYHKKFAFGDLKKQTLKEIVYNRERRGYIRDFNVKNCKPCWLGDRNRFIEYLLSENPEHLNYP